MDFNDTYIVDLITQKNHFTAKSLNQKAHASTPHLKDYMKQTKDNGLKTAHAVDAALKLVRTTQNTNHSHSQAFFLTARDPQRKCS
jgi:hypothetical protein